MRVFFLIIFIFIFGCYPSSIDAEKEVKTVTGKDPVVTLDGSMCNNAYFVINDDNIAYVVCCSHFGYCKIESRTQLKAER